MILNLLFLILSLALVVFSADLLVSGASSIAKKTGISSFVIGLTVVAFGTSAPELAVNVFSSIRGESAIAFGNVAGSNIFNILVILGIASIIHPLSTGKGTVWREIPIALAAALSVLLFSFSGIGGYRTIGRLEGIIMLSLFIIFIFSAFRKERSYSDSCSIKLLSNMKTVFYVISGLAGLFLGGRFVVHNAVNIAQILNIDERIISLTIVAAGTSLPELATSVVAAVKKADDIAVGNIVGSNIFNVFFILALSSIIRPIQISDKMMIDISVMILSSLILFIAMFTGRKRVIDRFEGIIMLIMYMVYLLYILTIRV